MEKTQQLSDLAAAYQAFVQITQRLSTEEFLTPIGNWTTRDICAHFIGWNVITHTGCSEVIEGKKPWYFFDGTNDYRKVNAEFFTQYPSKDRDRLLGEMATSMGSLATYLKTIPETDWERDTGVVHYRGGPATAARCVDSLIRDYRKHGEEIIQGLGK